MEKSTPTAGGGTMANSISNAMNELKDKFKIDDDELSVSPFQGLDKASVLQETGIFSDANIVKREPQKCCQLITKLLHILTQGEPFTSLETQNVFFGVTKLFQSTDSRLRRMMYLFIKEVAETTAKDDVIIVTQSLTKDMNSDVDLYRANSIRVLCRIIDANILNMIDRYIKQAIVDNNSLVASSALVSGIHLSARHPDVIRRWNSEVQEAMNSQCEMVQYHAVSLLYEMKKHDKLAVSKFVIQLKSLKLRSPLATCLLIRYAANILRDDMSTPAATSLYQILEGFLRNKSDMVKYEAARSICSLPIEGRDITTAINVLQVFLSSNTTTLRFAAVRTLSQVAMKSPMFVMKCNEDMESLITDSNRSIATLAITTLLKTGAESSVDRLMKQIASFMNEIEEEFKVVVVDAIQSLCVKYPSKHHVLLHFLSTLLREEGGFEFKQKVIHVIMAIIDQIPESKEIGMLHLCEFIEDCEFTQLSVQILFMLGEKSPTTKAPARYIRFIYNRLILENAHVRASAITALAKIGLRVKNLSKSILILLNGCIDDDDDEVRDRALLYSKMVDSYCPDVFLEKLPMTGLALHKSFEQYKLRPAHDGPVQLVDLPFVAAEVETKSAAPMFSQSMASPVKSAEVAEPEDVAKELYTVPEFADLGPLFCSSSRIELTAAEQEYVVMCIKHVFKDHVVLQFEIMNTISQQVLKDVSIEYTMSDTDVWSEHTTIPLESAVYGEKGSCYVCLSHEEEGNYSALSMKTKLKFKVFDVDTETGQVDEEGFDEEYPMEDMLLTEADFMTAVQVPDFRSAWTQIGDEGEVREQYRLQFPNVTDGITAVLEYFGMHACDGSGTVKPGAQSHILLLSGVFLGGIKVLVKSKLSMDEESNMVLQMAVRADDKAISEIVSNCIR